MLDLKEKLNYYRQHWFVRNVLTLQAGSFAGTAFQAVAGVFIARLLQPELFGIYSLAFGMASIGGIFLGAGNQEAVSTLLSSAYAKKDSREVKEVLAFLIKITIYAGILTLLALRFFPWLAQYFYENSAIGLYASVIIGAVFLSTSFNAVVQLGLQVTGKIKALTSMLFGDQFFRFGASLILVAFGFGVFGAVIGQLIGAAIIFLISIFLWKWLKKEERILPSLRELFVEMPRVSIRKYFGFSFWVAVDRNMGNLYMALPIVLAGIFVSAGEVSYFRLAFGYVNLALTLLGPVSVLLNVEFPKMKIGSEERLGKNFIKVSLYGLGLSTLLTLGAVLVSPVVFRILYGESFAPSIPYVFGLVFYGALFGIGVGLGPMWRAINKVKISIVINLIILSVGVPAGLLLIKYLGNWGAVIMVTSWFTVSHLTSFIYISRKLRQLPKI